MISEWFLGLWPWFVGLVADIFGEWDPPPELLNAMDGLTAVLGTMAGFGVWVDWGVLGACSAAALTVFTIVLGIKTARWLIGLIPTMGGGS